MAGASLDMQPIFDGVSDIDRVIAMPGMDFDDLFRAGTILAENRQNFFRELEVSGIDASNSAEALRAYGNYIIAEGNAS